MNKYKFWNNIIGWALAFIASAVYIMTAEPTTSFWDCGEYISTSYKLMVGHPPGAPLFQLIGRFFSLFAFGNVENVAFMVNIMSALVSGLSIMFLYWSITMLAKKIVVKAEESTLGEKLSVFGAGIVGALAYTFSDTFWFSAVEGEVYAMSSFFTAVTFWAILKWEQEADDKHALRWIVFIAYLVGLSIGVHLLNLLTIPAVAFVYVFKKRKDIKLKGILITLFASIILLAVVQYGIIPWIVKLSSWSEILFVNVFNMPFNSGTIIYFLAIGGLIYWGIKYSIKKQKQLLNTAILCFTFIIIGYSSFFLLIIRSNSGTPINENAPKDAVSLLAYLNREQYGESPLFYGQYFNAPLDPSNPIEDGSPIYSKGYAVLLNGDVVKEFVNKEKADIYAEDLKKAKANSEIKVDGRYIVTDERKNSKPNYDPRFCTFFPRMYSADDERGHPETYKSWGGIQGTPIQVQMANGQTQTIYKPTFGENLAYFFNYQIAHMYIRYFMWNFAGRQNDIQGDGSMLEGNWISGINFIDEMRLGPQKNMPEAMKNNKARNEYYLLPFILGFVGLFYHINKNSKDALVVGLLFFMTGLAIVIYLNQPPNQPRERDYAFAASFYAFAIWIGLGTLALINLLQKKLKQHHAAIIATILCIALVPSIMAKENWDDHDRSNRYMARDFALNYLNSCPPNAILFTNGDNDTFPLWYAQEVEGLRTDVKIVNLSLLNTDWYIDMMSRKKTYDADPVPMSLDPEKYVQSKMERILFYELKNVNGYVDLKEVMTFIQSDNPNAKITLNNGSTENFIPTKSFRLKVDSAYIVNNGIVTGKMKDSIVKNVDWRYGGYGLTKSQIAMLDIIASNNWKRPICFASTTGRASYMGLDNYLRLEGLAYRLVPIKSVPNNNTGEFGNIDTDILYDNVMNKFKWGNINADKIYLDENIQRMSMSYKFLFARLADNLLTEGKIEKAIKVLDKSVEIFPDRNIPFDYFTLSIAEGYFNAANAKTDKSKEYFEKGKVIIDRVYERNNQDINYYFKFKGGKRTNIESKIQMCVGVVQRIMQIAKAEKYEELAQKAEKDFETYYKMYML